MKNHPLSPEEKADRALENFQEIKPVEPSAIFDSKMFTRFEKESVKSVTPKWFWAAALVILAINVIAGYNYASSSSIETTSETLQSNVIGSYYFQGGTDWYSQ